MSDHPWPTAEEIAKRHNGVLDRDWSKFDLSECRHSLMVNATPVGVGQPDWFVEYCPICGHTESRCNHNLFEWNEAGTLLRCKTCGIDGT